MDGRASTGILYVNTDVDAPHKRDEYHRWYLDIHFPEVTGPAIFTDAVMFLNARAPLPREERTFLAMYETSWPDLEGAAQAFEQHVETLFAADRIHPGTVGGTFALLRRRRIEFGPQGSGRTQSLVALHLDAAGGASEALCDWGDAQAAAAVGPGSRFHSASFWERIETAAFARSVRADQPRFLLMLESDRGDPVALAEHAPTASLPAAAALRGVSCFYRSSGD
jgi:hypothetical protein